jgi:hypothetical protein
MRHLSPAVALALTILTLNPGTAAAQPAPDFLFGSPNGMVGFRGGLVFASANSDLFTFVEEHLTLERKDFNAPAIGVDLELAVTPRASVIAGFDFSKTSKDSEYRDFVDNQRLPITQTTSLREMNFGGSLKFALTPRGREVSSRAWIPAAATPYIGTGAGLMQYEFLQFGDFIDVDDPDLSIFTDTIRSSGWTPSAHVFGGVDVKIWRRLYLSGEARYLWARGSTEGRDDRGNEDPFRAFGSIDLAGFKTTVGIHYLF